MYGASEGMTLIFQYVTVCCHLHASKFKGFFECQSHRHCLRSASDRPPMLDRSGLGKRKQHHLNPSESIFSITFVGKHDSLEQFVVPHFSNTAWQGGKVAILGSFRMGPWPSNFGTPKHLRVGSVNRSFIREVCKRNELLPALGLL